MIMGGMFDGQPITEWNIRVDPEAASEVFTAWAGQRQLPIVCGLDLTRRVAMTPDILARLASVCGSSPVMRVIEDALRFYFESHEARGHGYLAYMHDPLAAAVAMDPELLTTRTATVDVDPTGATVTDWSGKRNPNARIGMSVDPAVFFDRFVERIGRFARRT
ncbi:nucleoside hydrolase LunH [Mycobacterium tuberculosis TKK_03_0026]|nr:nucleoside hydrolase LunH [Mycobacterium tuberculosis TKK_03_0026]